MRYPDPFEAIWEKVKPFTMTSRNRGFALYEAVNHVLDNGIPGAFVECGVWRGGSSMIIALAFGLLCFGVGCISVSSLHPVLRVFSVILGAATATAVVQRSVAATDDNRYRWPCASGTITGKLLRGANTIAYHRGLSGEINSWGECWCAMP